MLVNTDEICAAIKDIFEDTRAIAEPAGALAVAGLTQVRRARERRGQDLRRRSTSGANLNFDRLRHVAERAELGEQREALIAVEIPERPGSFLRFCEALGARSVTEFNYRYGDATRAQIFVGVEISHGRDDKDAVDRGARGAGFNVIDMSDNEMAKLHVRYMVGGHAPGSRTSGSIASSFRSGPARCCASCARSARAGTSPCSTTATTAPIMVACSPGSRFPPRSASSSCCT